MTYVYFIDGGNERYVKVGRSNDPKHRLHDARVWVSGAKPKMIDWFKADLVGEQMLHAYLRPFRVRGEWFDCLDQIEHIVEELDDYRHKVWLERRIKAGLPFDDKWPGLSEIDCMPAIRAVCANPAWLEPTEPEHSYS